MTPFATAADLAAIWRPLSDAEAARADEWLAVASARIRHRFAGIDARIADGTLDPALPGHVAVMMVKRVLSARSPDDPTTERIGEAQRGWPASAAAAELTITDDEIALLSPPRAPRARTINLGVGVPLP